MTAHLITEPLRVEACPRCDATTLRGHTGGLNVYLDPHPLDPHAELAALLTGKRTFDVYIESWSVLMYVEWRDAARIDAGQKHPVIAQHKCQRHRRPPGPRPMERGDLSDQRPDIDTSEDIPPF